MTTGRNLSDTVVLLPQNMDNEKVQDEERMMIAPLHKNQDTGKNSKNVELFLIRDLRIVRREPRGGSEAGQWRVAAGQEVLLRWVLLLALLAVSAALLFVLLKNAKEGDKGTSSKEFILPEEISDILEGELRTTTEAIER